jgi:hypothetical protein
MFALRGKLTPIRSMLRQLKQGSLVACILLPSCLLQSRSHAHTMNANCKQVCAAAIRAGLLLRFLEQKSVVSILMGLMELVLCVVSAACVAWSRVYLGYHTTDQVLCAAVLGGLFGLAWVWMMSKLNSLFSYLARSSLGQLLNVKNTWGIADTLYLEALAHRQIRGGAAVRSKKQT